MTSPEPPSLAQGSGVETRKGCWPFAIALLVLAAGGLLWIGLGGFERLTAPPSAGPSEDLPVEQDGSEREPGSGEARRATLDSGQVIEGDFEVRTLEEIEESGDVGATMAVAIENDPAALRRLLQTEGFDANRPIHYSESSWDHPLEKAVRQGSQETFEILLEAGADPNGQSSGGDTALHSAAYKGLVSIAERLLEAGADPELTSEGGLTPIEVAAWNGQLEVVQLLLDHGARPQYSLNAAGRGNHLEMMRLLLTAGADATAIDPYDNSMLRGAASQGHLEACRLLLEAGARPRDQGLREAASGGHVHVFRLFDEYGVRFDRPPASWDPLFTAAYAGQAEVVRLLLELGASPHGGEGSDPPIQAASTQGHPEIVEILRAAGAELPAEAAPDPD